MHIYEPVGDILSEEFEPRDIFNCGGLFIQISLSKTRHILINVIKMELLQTALWFTFLQF